MTGSTYAAELAHVGHAFGSVVALRDLSLTVPAGCVYGLIGPNGAGKTTSIRLLMGILRPDRGTATVLGGRDPVDVKHLLGYLPEEKGLYRKMRVLELIAFFGELKNMRRPAARNAASAWLERFDLADRAHDRCGTLSKGMAQKVQLICTLIAEPSLVVLDEPFTGLDPVNAQLVRDVIRDLRAANRGVILSTHTMELAEQLCDEITLVHQGRDILSGDLAGILNVDPAGNGDERSGGSSVLHARCIGDPSPVTRHPAVESLELQGPTLVVRLNDPSAAPEVIHELTRHVTLTALSTDTRSLHDVFVAAVTGSSSEFDGTPEQPT